MSDPVNGMANPEHLSILKSGVSEWNNWRFKNPFVSPDLESVDLRGISLSGVDFGSHVCMEGFSICSLGEMTDVMANGWLCGKQYHSRMGGHCASKGCRPPK
jgi:hypothetical protein